MNQELDQRQQAVLELDKKGKAQMTIVFGETWLPELIEVAFAFYV